VGGAGSTELTLSPVGFLGALGPQAPPGPQLQQPTLTPGPGRPWPGVQEHSQGWGWYPQN
jgi:hypothetical protein